MQATRPFILYTLPKSRTTQGFLHGHKIEKIWNSLKIFFEQCTTASISHPSKIELSVYLPVIGDKDPVSIERYVSEIRGIIGQEIPDDTSSGLPDKLLWKPSQNELLKVIEYMINGSPWPKFTYGPVELFLVYRFRLLELDTKKELVNQEIESSILIWLSKSCSCSADLWLPFADSNSEFYNYVNKLEFLLPFKLEYKYLKKGRPNKGGTNHIFNRLIK